MAWPLSRLLTFIPRSTPRIPAAWLNQIQDTLNDLFNGVISVVAVVADGVGGQVVTPIAGTMQVAAALAETAFPTAVRALGTIAKDHIPGGLAHIDGGGAALLAGVNIKDVTRNGAGDYTVTFSFVPPGPSGSRAVVLAVPRHNTADRVRVDSYTLEGGTNYLQVRLVFPADCFFYVVAWAV